MGSTMRKNYLSFCILTMFGASAFGQRVFVVPAGTTPGNGEAFTIQARGGEVLVLEVWLENVPADVGTGLVRGWQATLPCNASGGVTGSIDYDATIGPVIEMTREDYIFAGVNPSFPATNPGQCPTLDPVSSPHGLAAVFPGDQVPVTEPRYLTTFTYHVSSDAEGVFAIAPLCVPTDGCPPPSDGTTRILYAVGATYPDLVSAPITIEVPRGQCCIGSPPVCEMLTELECDAAGGSFRGDRTCADLCRCVSDAQCADDDTCTIDRCIEGECEHRPIPYGDLFPCGGNGVVDIDDIVALLNAFSGQRSTCPAPCP